MTKDQEFFIDTNDSFYEAILNKKAIVYIEDTKYRILFATESSCELLLTLKIHEDERGKCSSFAHLFVRNFMSWELFGTGPYREYLRLEKWNESSIYFSFDSSENGFLV